MGRLHRAGPARVRDQEERESEDCGSPQSRLVLSKKLRGPTRRTPNYDSLGTHSTELAACQSPDPRISQGEAEARRRVGSAAPLRSPDLLDAVSFFASEQLLFRCCHPNPSSCSLLIKEMEFQQIGSSRIIAE
ncbi:hypothetical protein AXF42_Ash016494 [Apostasia shenzhenica]|uniref:Uncharacterized protein n=1 Tax=Apostasia shenzhenica TaxID=1088818 RepID=A0A2I0AVA1_9ASPA|nr:hypothetical protein AXF42_Ash016494 [Apostasia shenzhenica]